MVGRVGVTGQYLMTDFKKQANIQMSPNDEGHVLYSWYVSEGAIELAPVWNPYIQITPVKTTFIQIKKDEV